MSTTIESLELELQASSQSAESGLDALSASLEKLKKATSGGVGLASVTKQIKALGEAAKGVASASISNIDGLTKAISTLSNLGGLKLSSTIATQITAISNSAKGLSGVNFTPISDLANALQPLSTVGKVSLTSAINQLQRIPELANQFMATDMTGFKTKIQELVSALSPLSTMPKQTISSTLNQIKKIPEVFAGLQAVGMGAFTTKIQELATALKPLADEMNKVAAGFSAFPAKIQKLLSTTNNLSAANKKAANSYTEFYHKIKTAYTAVKSIASKIATWIKSSSDYVETINLFSVSMGKYADSAYQYAQTVSEAMGIDPEEWMRGQGVFMTLVKGFGVAGDRANTMSQQLTQLGYDLSSFFNISSEDAMQKLQSGISGELEPLRRLGYDLSQAKLQAVALSLGIDKSFNSMTQAEKAQLRYYAIMTQVTDAQGDMARTLDAPANQLRVLTAQVTQLGRALGNFFIPILNRVLPYIIAAVKVMRELLASFMGLLGIELSTDNLSAADSITSATEEISDNIDDGTDSAKKLKSYLLGFDELNVIDPTSGIDDLSDNSDGFDFELPTYDFMDNLVASRVDEVVEKMKEWLGITGEIDSWADFFDTKLGKIAIGIGTITAGIAAWKVSKNLLKALTLIKSISSKKFSLSFSLIGAILFIADLDKLRQYLEDFGENGATFSNVSGIISEFAGLVGDALILLGKVEIGGALKVVQGIGELVSAIADISKEGVDWDNMTTLIRGLTNIAIGVGLFTKNLTLTGAAMAVQGFTTVINEIANNWDAIKKGDWSGVDKATLAIGAIEVLGGVVTALGVFSKIKQATDVSKAATAATEVATATEAVSTTTSTLTTKLTTLVKDLGLGIAILAEVAAATALFVGAIWVVGKELEQVGIAWQPVLDNGETIAIAVGIGTGLLVAIGVVTAALGTAGTALIVNIALGTAMLAEIGVATGLFLVEIWGIGKGLDEIGKAWQPVLDNGETIAIGIGVGTALLIGIGVVTAALGVAAVATAGMLPLAIGLGTALLLELGVALGLFIIEIVGVAKGLDEINTAWQPVLDDGETISTGIGVGTGLLIGIGVVTAALGVATVATVGLLPLAIALGTGMLVELSVAFGEFCDSLSDVAGDIKDTIAPSLKNVNAVLPGVKSDMSDFVSFMVAFAGDMVIYSASSSISGIAATIDKFIDFFTTDPVKRLSDEIDDQYDNMISLKQNLQNVLPVIKDATSLLDEYNVEMDKFEAASGTGGGIIGSIGKLLEFSVNIGVSLVRNGWKTVSDFIGTSVDVVVNRVEGWFTTLASWIGSSTDVTVYREKGWSSSLSSWIGSSVDVKVGLVKGWTGSIAQWIGDLATTLKIKLPHISCAWIDTGFMGIKYPSFGVSYYANGGFPDIGQMFIAREAGPEMVGTIGNRSAVANNDQIVDSVSLGVYRAVLEAMSATNSGDGDDARIVINLDGQKIYENQQKIARSRGYNLGMGAFSFG